MNVILNPGTGPVVGANAFDAYSNLLDLLKQSCPEFFREVSIKQKGRWEGYWTFYLKFEGRKCRVDMPGCGLFELTQHDGVARRCYVDESSWCWKFAKEMVLETLTGTEE